MTKLREAEPAPSNTLMIVVSDYTQTGPDTWLADVLFQLWLDGACVAHDEQHGVMLHGPTIDAATEAFAQGIPIEIV